MKLRLSDLWSWQGTIERGRYAFWGVLLFAVKHNLDRLVASWVVGPHRAPHPHAGAAARKAVGGVFPTLAPKGAARTWGTCTCGVNVGHPPARSAQDDIQNSALCLRLGVMPKWS